MTNAIKKRSNLRRRAGIFDFASAGSNFVSDAETTSTPVPTTHRYATDELFRGAKEITIVHRGELYRLRITARGKLILTK